MVRAVVAARRGDHPEAHGRCAGHRDLPLEVERFLQQGPPPLVFTLGSAAVLDAGDFYRQDALAAGLLGQRAVLLVGTDPRNVPLEVPENVCVANYAPYSKIFPRASVIIHQGGVGTTAQALISGKPMLVMPYSHDQPDNARRVRRLGVARVIKRRRYTAELAAKGSLCCWRKPPPGNGRPGSEPACAPRMD